MKKITQKELNRILASHRKWLTGKIGGKKANLAGIDLSGVCLAKTNLEGADLSFALLRKADLRHANLNHANLSYTKLAEADLRHANLDHANLSYASLFCARINKANLSTAILVYADLSGASLTHANLKDAILACANLTDADLTNAKMDGTDMAWAQLERAHGVLFYEPLEIVPSDGAFVGWKKLAGDAIAKLLIPADAKRCSTMLWRKCRCSSAKVLAIYDAHGKKIKKGFSLGDPDFEYRTGEVVHPDAFDENRWHECSNGIHFFITRKEAENYCS
jgi:hypothetical protein